MNVKSKAIDDVRRTIGALKGSQKRRAAPDWSLPTEALLMALQPSYVSAVDKAKLGVGMDKLDSS